MHSSRSYYPPDPYAVHQPQPHHHHQSSAGASGAYGGSAPYSQHNHPPYYGNEQPPPPPSQTHHQASASYYDSAGGSSGYPPTGVHHQPQTVAYHHQESVYGTTTTPHPSTSNYYGNVPTHPLDTGAGVAQNPYSSQPTAQASSIAQTSVKAKPSPFGASGPYGNDAQNSNLDYYRRLYYPYDPITGEYMKDATPPGGGADPSTSFDAAGRPYSSGIAGMGDSSGGGQWPASMNANAVTANAAGQMMMVNAAGGAGLVGANALNNPYFIRQYQDNDSLLLCCDFLIPRPSINCLIIALFTMLVLIVIFTVVKFTIIYPAVDKSHQETLVLVDQITVILLLCALAALIWIFGIYFTSRRTRRQISSLLSCAGSGPNSSSYARRMMRAGYPPGTFPNSAGTASAAAAYQTTLANDMQYPNTPYSRSSGRLYDATNTYGRQYPNFV